MSAMGGQPTEIYKTGLHTTSLLESMAEVVIGWQLLRHAEVSAPKATDDPFYLGKVESAKFFIADVAHQIAARRAAAEREDAGLMDLPVEAF